MYVIKVLNPNFALTQASCYQQFTSKVDYLKTLIKAKYIGRFTQLTYVSSSRAFQGPFTIRKRSIFARIVGRFNDVSRGLQMIMASSRTIQFIGIITTIVFAIALELSIDTLSVGAMERARGTCFNFAQKWHQCFASG